MPSTTVSSSPSRLQVKADGPGVDCASVWVGNIALPVDNGAVVVIVAGTIEDWVLCHIDWAIDCQAALQLGTPLHC